MKLLNCIFGKRPGAMTSEEVAVVGLLRASPTELLAGRDLIVAQLLASRGLLRKTAPQRFSLTEKGSVAYHAKH
jgi:hypothetical protein